MKILRYLVPALISVFLGGSAAAQTLPLDQLLKLGTLPAGLPLQKMTPALFPSEWTYRGQQEHSNETYWTASATDYDYADELDGPASSISLRPMSNGAVDVLFRTSQSRYFEPIHKELKRMKLPVVPVTCLDCEGERYEASNYTVTLYTGKKGPYPFIVVIHQDPIALAAPAGPRPVPVVAPPVSPAVAAPAPNLAGSSASKP